MSGNWKKYTYNETQPSNAEDVANQYEPVEALAIIKTLSIIHGAFDGIVERARKDATKGGGMVGLSIIYNLNLQKLINQTREKDPNTKLHELLFPEKRTKDGQEYHIGLVGLCKVGERLQLCQIISPFDVIREANVNAVKGNNRLKKVPTLTEDANHWLKNGDDWVEFELGDLGAYKEKELYVQVITKGDKTSGETQYTVTGGEKRLLIDGDEDDASGFVHADQFLLIPKLIPDDGDFDECDLTQTLFECGHIDMSSHQYAPLHDALLRNIVGNYKPHGRLYNQESYAQDHLDGDSPKLAVATPAVGEKLYCILCKRPISSTYDVDHIFNLIFNTYFDLNDGPRGFFDTCPKCNQAFKGEMLWCPNYDVWDALLKQLLESYHGREDRPQTIEACRVFFPWPGIKCQGVIPASGKANMRPFGGWRTFITGWHEKHEAREEAATAKLLNSDIGATLNAGEFDKAQSLKYPKGSNEEPLSKGDDDYLSTFVIQDLFLRRVLSVTKDNKLWLARDIKEGSDFVVTNQAMHSIAMASDWKKIRKSEEQRAAAKEAAFQDVPKSPGRSDDSAASSPDPNLYSQQTRRFMGLKAGDFNNKIKRGLFNGYLLKKVKEELGKNLRTLSGKLEYESLTPLLRSIERMRRIVNGYVIKLQDEMEKKTAMTDEQKKETTDTIEALQKFKKELTKDKKIEIARAVKELHAQLSSSSSSDSSSDSDDSGKVAAISDTESDGLESDRLEAERIAQEQLKKVQETARIDKIKKDLIRVFGRDRVGQGLKLNKILDELRQLAGSSSYYHPHKTVTKKKVIAVLKSLVTDDDNWTLGGSKMDPTYKYNIQPIKKRKKGGKKKTRRRKKRTRRRRKKKKKRTKKKRRKKKKTRGRR